ncbi:hypothetical protein ACFVFS_07095 [Kitasatospora sp. NPDC057692]|uniref:hypothetical protein n=1 Tax=Kitasatospora sp. NPDC057692 TaxID=3346215 RepID=UPI0036CA69E3
MGELLREDVRDPVDPDLMGALPDLEVPDASVVDWQALFDLVGSVPGWSWRYADGPVGGPLPPPARASPGRRPQRPPLLPARTRGVAVRRLGADGAPDFELRERPRLRWRAR